MESPAPAASAPPAADSSPAVETLTAVEHAATTGNMREFRAARAAERADKPLPSVTVTEEGEPVVPVPADAAPAAPKLSRKEREQQDANERTRKAVESATADIRAELDRLKAAAPRSEPKPAEPAPKETAVQMAKRFAALPDAPKLDQFDSVEEHAAAMALFINETYGAERTAESQSRGEAEAMTAAQMARVDGFITQLTAAKTADPTFTAALTEEVKALKPFDALKPGEPGGPRNVIAEQIYDSPIAPQVLRHLSEHPDDLKQLEAMPPHIAALPPRAREKAHIQHIVREYGKLEGRLATAATAPAPSTTKTVSEAPTVDTLGGHAAEAPADPVMSAAVKGDFKQFRAAKRARLAASRTS